MRCAPPVVYQLYGMHVLCDSSVFNTRGLSWVLPTLWISNRMKLCLMVYMFGVRFENTKDVVESYVHVIAATTVINEYYFAFICLSYKNQYWKKEEGRNVVLILFSRKQLPLCHCYHCCVKVSNQIRC